MDLGQVITQQPILHDRQLGTSSFMLAPDQKQCSPTAFSPICPNLNEPLVNSLDSEPVRFSMACQQYATEPLDRSVLEEKMDLMLNESCESSVHSPVSRHDISQCARQFIPSGPCQVRDRLHQIQVPSQTPYTVAEPSEKTADLKPQYLKIATPHELLGMQGGTYTKKGSPQQLVPVLGQKKETEQTCLPDQLQICSLDVLPPPKLAPASGAVGFMEPYSGFAPAPALQNTTQQREGAVSDSPQFDMLLHPVSYQLNREIQPPIEAFKNQLYLRPHCTKSHSNLSQCHQPPLIHTPPKTSSSLPGINLSQSHEPPLIHTPPEILSSLPGIPDYYRPDIHRFFIANSQPEMEKPFSDFRFIPHPHLCQPELRASLDSSASGAELGFRHTSFFPDDLQSQHKGKPYFTNCSGSLPELCPRQVPTSQPPTSHELFSQSRNLSSDLYENDISDSRERDRNGRGDRGDDKQQGAQTRFKPRPLRFSERLRQQLRERSDVAPKSTVSGKEQGKAQAKMKAHNLAKETDAKEKKKTNSKGKKMMWSRRRSSARLTSLDIEALAEHAFEEYMEIMDSLCAQIQGSADMEENGQEEKYRKRTGWKTDDIEEMGNSSFMEHLDELCRDEEFVRTVESNLDIDYLNSLVSSASEPIDLMALEEQAREPEAKLQMRPDSPSINTSTVSDSTSSPVESDVKQNEALMQAGHWRAPAACHESPATQFDMPVLHHTGFTIPSYSDDNAPVLARSVDFQEAQSDSFLIHPSPLADLYKWCKSDAKFSISRQLFPPAQQYTASTEPLSVVPSPQNFVAFDNCNSHEMPLPINVTPEGQEDNSYNRMEVQQQASSSPPGVLLCESNFQYTWSPFQTDMLTDGPHQHISPLTPMSSPHEDREHAESSSPLNWKSCSPCLHNLSHPSRESDTTPCLTDDTTQFPAHSFSMAITSAVSGDPLFNSHLIGQEQETTHIEAQAEMQPPQRAASPESLPDYEEVCKSVASSVYLAPPSGRYREALEKEVQKMDVVAEREVDNIDSLDANSLGGTNHASFDLSDNGEADGVSSSSSEENHILSMGGKNQTINRVMDEFSCPNTADDPNTNTKAKDIQVLNVSIHKRVSSVAQIMSFTEDSPMVAVNSYGDSEKEFSHLTNLPPFYHCAESVFMPQAEPVADTLPQPSTPQDSASTPDDPTMTTLLPEITSSHGQVEENVHLDTATHTSISEEVMAVTQGRGKCNARIEQVCKTKQINSTEQLGVMREAMEEGNQMFTKAREQGKGGTITKKKKIKENKARHTGMTNTDKSRHSQRLLGRVGKEKEWHSRKCWSKTEEKKPVEKCEEKAEGFRLEREGGTGKSQKRQSIEGQLPGEEANDKEGNAAMSQTQTSDGGERMGQKQNRQLKFEMQQCKMDSKEGAEVNDPNVSGSTKAWASVPTKTQQAGADFSLGRENNNIEEGAVNQEQTTKERTQTSSVAMRTRSRTTEAKRGKNIEMSARGDMIETLGNQERTKKVQQSPVNRSASIDRGKTVDTEVERNENQASFKGETYGQTKENSSENKLPSLSKTLSSSPGRMKSRIDNQEDERTCTSNDTDMRKRMVEAHEVVTSERHSPISRFALFSLGSPVKERRRNPTDEGWEKVKKKREEVDGEKGCKEELWNPTSPMKRGKCTGETNRDEMAGTENQNGNFGDITTPNESPIMSMSSHQQSPRLTPQPTPVTRITKNPILGHSEMEKIKDNEEKDGQKSPGEASHKETSKPKSLMLSPASLPVKYSRQTLESSPLLSPKLPSLTSQRKTLTFKVDEEDKPLMVTNRETALQYNIREIEICDFEALNSTACRLATGKTESPSASHSVDEETNIEYKTAGNNDPTIPRANLSPRVIEEQKQQRATGECGEAVREREEDREEGPALTQSPLKRQRRRSKATKGQGLRSNTNAEAAKSTDSADHGIEMAGGMSSPAKRTRRTSREEENKEWEKPTEKETGKEFQSESQTCGSSWTLSPIATQRTTKAANMMKMTPTPSTTVARLEPNRKCVNNRERESGTDLTTEAKQTQRLESHAKSGREARRKLFTLWKLKDDGKADTSYQRRQMHGGKAKKKGGGC